MRYWIDRVRPRWMGVLFLLILCIGPMEAKAFSPEARTLYDAAKIDLKEGRYSDALLGFKKALPLVVGDREGSWQILVAVALTYEKMGEAVHAAEYYGRFIARIQPSVDSLEEKWERRHALASETLEELQAFLSSTRVYVRIESTPAGAEVIIDGVRSGADMNARTPFETYLKPGNHAIGVRKEGLGSAHEVVTPVLGKAMVVHLKMGPEPMARTWHKSSDVIVDATSERMQTTSDLNWSIAGWTVLGIGAAALGTGAFFTVKAADAHEDLLSVDSSLGPIEGPFVRKGLISDLEGSELRAAALYAVGGVAVTVGTLLLFADDLGWVAGSSSADNSGSIRISPLDGGMLAVTRWSF